MRTVATANACDVCADGNDDWPNLNLKGSFAEFGPVRVRAFGTYAFHVADPATFLKQLVATDPSFESYEISAQLRNTVVSRFTDVIGSAKIPVLDMAGNYDKISKIALLLSKQSEE